MENINEILASLGIQVPEDKAQELASRVASNYKTVAEFDKKVNKANDESENLRNQLAEAKKTIEAFNAEDVEGMKSKLAEYQTKVQTLESDYNKRIEERDFEDALKQSMESVKFTSNAAKNAVMAQIREAGLKLVNGKIMGLNDMLESIKKSDESAFQKDDDGGAPPAKFTAPIRKDGGKKYATKDEIMAIKDAVERQKAIAENINLFK